MGQRITRAKAKIKAARIPYRVPSAEDLPARVSGVLAVLFLVFNEGYLATGPDTDPVRARPDRRGDPAHPPDPRPDAGGRRGGRAAGADAPHRGPPHRPGLGERRAGHPRRAGPRGLGRGAGRRGPSAGARAPGRRGGSRVATRSSPRSTPCTPRPATCATPTGRRSSPSTTSSSASTRRRSSPSTGPSRSPSSTARRWRWPPSTGSRSTLAGYHAYHATRADLLRRLGRSQRVARGVRPGHRAGGQHRRDRLPDPPPRPAGLTALSVGTTPGHPPRRHSRWTWSRRPCQGRRDDC